MAVPQKTQEKTSVSAALKVNPYRATNGVTDRVVPQKLLQEVAKAISNIRGWGSVEIFIQDHKVTQITERNIKKTNAQLVIED